MVYNLLVDDELNVNIFEIEHILYHMICNYYVVKLFFKHYMINQNLLRLGITTVLLLAGEGSRFTKMGYTDPPTDVNGLPMVVQAISCLPQ